jgi:hypothetical protein
MEMGWDWLGGEGGVEGQRLKRDVRRKVAFKKSMLVALSALWISCRKQLSLQETNRGDFTGIPRRWLKAEVSPSIGRFAANQAVSI